MHYMKAPFNLVTAYTYRCNLKCKHCFAASHWYDPAQLKKTEMSTTQWKRILTDAAEMGVHEVYFGGGEPLFREDFLDVAGHARRAGLGVTLTTNGTLVTGELARCLADLGIECIEVSIDGIEKTHDYLRGVKGSYERASRTVEMLAELGIYTIASMTINARNVSEMRSVYDEMCRRGASEVLYMRFVPTGSGKAHRSELFISGVEFRKAVEVFCQERYAGTREEMRCQSNSDGFFYPHAGCIPGRTYCFIRPNGDVTPCNPLIFPRGACGNLQQEGLRRIWEEGPGFKFVRELDFAALPSCLTCSKRDICSGGCRILCALYREHCHGDCEGCKYSVTCNEANGLCGKKYMYYVRTNQ